MSGWGSKRWKEKKGSQKEVEKVDERGAKKKERCIKKREDIRENSWEGGEKITIKKKKKKRRQKRECWRGEKETKNFKKKIIKIKS